MARARRLNSAKKQNEKNGPTRGEGRARPAGFFPRQKLPLIASRGQNLQQKPSTRKGGVLQGGSVGLISTRRVGGDKGWREQLRAFKRGRPAKGDRTGAGEKR